MTNPFTSERPCPGKRLRSRRGERWEELSHRANRQCISLRERSVDVEDLMGKELKQKKETKKPKGGGGKKK
ncbi:MAG: hypothetical protein ACYCW6_24520 [Candidatus Xenobia bacterium]